MFPYPNARIPFRIVAIDPGSSSLGVAVLDFHLDDLTIDLIDARTFTAGRMLNEYELAVEVQGERFARLLYMGQALGGYLTAMRPQGVASEAPYMGRFPAAYRALCECVLVIQQSVMNHDPFMRLHFFDPMTVKAAVGVVAKGYRNKAALAKEHVRSAVLGLPLNNPYNIDMAALDEHSIDAIAVGMARIKAMLSN